MSTTVEDSVRLMIKHNCLHLKSGIRLAEATWADVILHLVKEIRELNEELAKTKHEDAKVGKWQTPEVEEELADMFGILVHCVVKAGYTMDDIERRCLLKFKERFENVHVRQICNGLRTHLVLEVSGESTTANTGGEDPIATGAEGSQVTGEP